MLKQLLLSIFIYLRLCFMKDSPVSIPYSNPILILLAIALVALRIVAFEASPGIEQSDTIKAGILSVGLLLLFLFTVTYSLKKQLRWHKLANAILGTELVLFLMIYPVLLALPKGAANAMIGLLILFWTLAVKGNIFKKTLEISMISGISLAFAMEIVTYLPFGFLIAETTSR